MCDVIEPTSGLLHYGMSFCCDVTRLTAAVGQTPTRMVIEIQIHRVLPNLIWFKSVPRIITNVYKQLQGWSTGTRLSTNSHGFGCAWCLLDARYPHQATEHDVLFVVVCF